MFLGWEAAGESISFVMRNAKLMIFIIFAFIFTILTLLTFNSFLGKNIIGEITLIMTIDKRTDLSPREKLQILEDRKRETPLTTEKDYLRDIIGQKNFNKLPLVFLWYLLIAFIATFFGAGLARCTLDALHREEVSVIKGLTAATKNILSIFLWSVLAATVGIVFNIIERKFEKVGRSIKNILGFSWECASFFVIPIVATENINPFGALGKSSNLFIKHFGDTFTGQFRISVTLFLILFILFPIGLFIGAIFLLPLSETGINTFFMILLGFLVLFAVFSATIQNVFITNLYYGIVRENNQRS